MNRGVITISESGTVSMPTDTVWMTMQEIADMYNVFGCYVRKAVKAVFKDGILKEQGVRRHVRKNDRISYDVALEPSRPSYISMMVSKSWSTPLPFLKTVGTIGIPKSSPNLS